jgi:hypothetical protein
MAMIIHSLLARTVIGGAIKECRARVRVCMRLLMTSHSGAGDNHAVNARGNCVVAAGQFNGGLVTVRTPRCISRHHPVRRRRVE